MFAVQQVRLLRTSHGFILSRAERSHWRDKGFVSVSDAEKREHTCPLEEYVRRSTGEIVENVSWGYLSRAERSHWRDEVTSVCLTPKNRNTAILLRSVFAV